MVDSDGLRREGGSTARQGGVEGDRLVDGGGGGGRSERERGRRLGDVGDVDGHDNACRCLIGAVTGEGGVVGACAGGAEARGDGDLAGGVGGVGRVVVADVVEVVVDSDGLRREGGSTARQGGVEGDRLVDGGGGGGRSERERGRRLGDVGDVDGHDNACRCLIGAVTGEGGVVGALSGGAKACCDGDLTGGVGGVGGVVVAGGARADVVVDRDVLS